jgi:penicillin-binding protein 1A
LPDLDAENVAAHTPRTSVVYAADGSVLAEWHGSQDRTVIPMKTIPPAMRQAVVAIEDRRFYEHHGIDADAIARALAVNARSGGVEQGGSTITQQLVKVLFDERERTITRKVREALLAVQLEAKSDKDSVLGTYLNVVYFGQGAYGVEAAARTYFGKHAADLTVPEAALLAGVIRSPSRYDPLRNPTAALERRNLVLAAMRDVGSLTSEQEVAYRAAPLGLKPPKEKVARAPYYVEYVKQQLIDRLGSERVFAGGLRVYTGLDPRIQAAAETSARRALPAASDPEVAVVTIDHSTGAIKAMVGGRDFNRNRFNIAAQGRRQPGSAFKTFVLVTALERGVDPRTVVSAAPYSVPTTDGVWTVRNYENRFASGALSVHAATVYSVNAVYARLVTQLTPKRVVETAHRMGITSPLEPNPAIALGGLTYGVTPLEMASAYGTVAAGGRLTEPWAVAKVTDDSGAVVFQASPKSARVLSPSIAQRTSAILHDVVEKGTGTAARIGPWTAGKTGTTQSYRDAWFVGYSGNLVTSVWVGYPAAQKAMTRVHGIPVTGGSFPAAIWAGAMGPVLVPKASVAASVRPEAGGVRVRICLDTLQLANERCVNTADVVLDPSQVPRGVCTRH